MIKEETWLQGFNHVFVTDELSSPHFPSCHVVMLKYILAFSMQTFKNKRSKTAQHISCPSVLEWHVVFLWIVCHWLLVWALPVHEASSPSWCRAVLLVTYVECAASRSAQCCLWMFVVFWIVESVKPCDTNHILRIVRSTSWISKLLYNSAGTKLTLFLTYLICVMFVNLL